MLAPAPERFELLRALGSVTLTPPPSNASVWGALDLAAPTAAEHTEVFVLGLPPHAAVYLGPEGKLGGQGLERVGGFWRALSMPAPEDADHLGALLMLYAELGSAELDSTDPQRASALRRSREALLHEHLWSWAPPYLHAVSVSGVATLAAWADLAAQALSVEHACAPAAADLPLALREAPWGLAVDDSVADLLDSLVAPVRSGLFLTQHDLRAGARAAGVGFRRGERRFALRAMLEQDAPATLDWLAGQAADWVGVHTGWGSGDDAAEDPTGRWWTARARTTDDTLRAALADLPEALR